MNHALHLLPVLLVLAASADAQQPTTGSIAGTIRYVGVVPPNQRIFLTDGQLLLHNDIVVHPKTRGLRDVAVLVDWKVKTAPDARAKPVVIDQRDMIFLPRVATVTEGQGVRFENNDLYNHGVTAISATPANAFNVITPAGRPYEHQFKIQKNPIPIGCALHAWMKAYIIPVAHPYHAVTGADGKFRMDRVPAGKHTLMLIHPDTGYRDSLTIDVQPGKTAEVSLDWKTLTRK